MAVLTLQFRLHQISQQCSAHLLFWDTPVLFLMPVSIGDKVTIMVIRFYGMSTVVIVQLHQEKVSDCKQLKVPSNAVHILP